MVDLLEISFLGLWFVYYILFPLKCNEVKVPPWEGFREVASE